MSTSPSRRRTVPPDGFRRREAPAAPAGLRPASALWPRAGLALLPLACVALNGGTTRWCQALVLLALGALLLAAPPRASLGRGLNAVLLGLVFLALMAFLPARWFAWPAWRAALVDDFGTALPPTLSPQPWLSAESLVVFLAGLSWLYLMATVNWTGEERRRAGRLFAGGIVALAALFLALYRLGLIVPIWPNERHFGPFPNRNHTADFLAVGALPVLACAHSAWRAGRRAVAAGWLAGWLVVAAALFNNYSRAGIGILFAGTALYLGGETFRSMRRPQASTGAARVAGWRRIALAVSLILVLASSFFLFGGDTLARLRPGTGGGAATADTPADFRVNIQTDALHLIGASPWCGLGLGNFADVFQVYRQRSAIPMRALHPESDWLWMAAELGWPALVLGIAGCVMLARRLRLPRHGSDRPLRTAAALGAAAFVVHGLVDVAGHRFGTAFSAVFLLGLAMPGRGDGSNGDSRPVATPARWPAILFRVLGVGFLAVGALWTLEARGVLLLPGTQGVERMEAETAYLGDQHDFAGAEQAAARGLEWAPLNWQLSFAHGAAGIYLRHDPDAALADFRRARYLEPFAASLPLAEARLWASAREFPLAVSAMAEACRREPDHAAGYLSSVDDAAGRDPEFHAQAGVALRHDLTLEMTFLGLLFPPESVQAIAAFVDANPDLRGFDDAQTLRFLRLWAGHGDAAALVAAMPAHPAWQTLGWRWWAEACARAGAVEQACGIAAGHAPRPAVPPAPAARPLATLQTEAAQAPGDPALALALYGAQRQAGNLPAAAAALRAATARPDCPAYFHYLAADASAGAGQWAASWEAWRRYLEAIKADE